MKQWMKKISVFLITVMTLGLYTPPIDIHTVPDDTDTKAFVAEKESNHAKTASLPIEADTAIHTVTLSEADYMINNISEQARQHTLDKLGPKIVSKIEPAFTEAITENIDATVREILMETGEENLKYIGISELPSEGYGEKIFTIHDYGTDKAIARFDVRRENRPGEGYWFHFHYHAATDHFEKHYELGELFWDKNMPPKWMA